MITYKELLENKLKKYLVYFQNDTTLEFQAKNDKDSEKIAKKLAKKNKTEVDFIL